jgi:antitoxin (DNA-binding transcriptional repressor) of toxin-antitoxin stability system
VILNSGVFNITSPYSEYHLPYPERRELPTLLDEVECGEEVVITKHDRRSPASFRRTLSARAAARGLVAWLETFCRARRLDGLSLKVLIEKAGVDPSCKADHLKARHVIPILF